MAQHIARVIIVVVIFTVTAFAWKRYASASCAALVFPVGWTGFLILFFRERLLWKRRCLSGCAFQDEVLLRRLTSSATLPTILATLMALLLGTIAAMEALMRPQSFIILLTGAGLLSAWLIAVLTRWLQSSTRDSIAHIVVKTWAGNLTALMLLCIMTGLMLLEPAPDWLSEHLFITLNSATDLHRSVCTFTDELLYSFAVQDALTWWSMASADGVLGQHLSPLTRTMAWLTFIITDGLSALGFAYLLTQIIHRTGRQQ